jgi:hypothetical protein
LALTLATIKNKTNLNKAGKTSLLPQYENSESMYERFLDATLNESEEVYRAKKEPGTRLATIDPDENDYDNLDYFTEPINKKKLEDEFFNELAERIGKEKTELFCKLISEYWYDGRTRRIKSDPMLKLQRSIQNYLLEYRKVTSIENIQVINQISSDLEYSFEDDEINEILSLNREMTDHNLQNWLEGHANYLEMGMGDIYFRRGIYLDKEPTNPYQEWLYINSYSLSFSVTEKFVQERGNKTPIIFNTNYANLRDRILFFSPFIKGMPPFQLELGIIPHYFTLKSHHQGTYGEIEEYIVD